MPRTAATALAYRYDGEILIENSVCLEHARGQAGGDQLPSDQRNLLRERELHEGDVRAWRDRWEIVTHHAYDAMMPCHDLGEGDELKNLSPLGVNDKNLE
jgi:hypothetical protein